MDHYHAEKTPVPSSSCKDGISNIKFVWADDSRVVQACFLVERCGDCMKDYLTAFTFSGIHADFDGSQSNASGCT